jgi:hypothetical protein
LAFLAALPLFSSRWEGFEEEWRVPTFAGHFLVTQAVLVMAAFGAYASMQREADDPKIVRRACGQAGAVVLLIFLPYLVLLPSEMWFVPIAAHEAYATARLRELAMAEATYAEMYHAGFTEGLNRLGSGDGPPNREHANLVNEVLAGRAWKGTNTFFMKTGMDSPTDQVRATIKAESPALRLRPGRGTMGSRVCGASSSTNRA